VSLKFMWCVMDLTLGLYQTSQDDTGAGVRRSCRLMAAVIRLAFVAAAYGLAWSAAWVFVVPPGVSVIFFPAALTVFVVMILGLRWLPVVYALFAGFGAQGDFSAVTWSDHLDALRHVGVYGVAGWYLGRIWPHSSRRLSLNAAVRFTGVALLASIVSAGLSLAMRTIGAPAVQEFGPELLSAWGADLAGLMIGIPVMLFLGAVLRGGRRGVGGEFRGPFETTVFWPAMLHVLFALSAAVFAVWLPAAMGVDTQIAMLMLLPVVLSGLTRGALVGFAMMGIAGTAYMLTGMSLGADFGEPIELQLFLAVAAGLALISGAASDDRLAEWRQGHHDMLTGLPNRRMLMERMDQAWRRAQRNATQVVILYIDLDRFKGINDSLGHDAGDQVLVEAAERITGCVRASDTVARLSGDEFVVMLPDVDPGAGTTRVADDILKVLSAPFFIRGHRISISGSVGIAIFPHDGNEPEMVLHRADEALYAAKAEGRNRRRFWRQT
jgi:diguanylate cyclase (GGDEF)-like protein